MGRHGGMVRRVVAVGWRRTQAVGAYATGISANRSLSAFADLPSPNDPSPDFPLPAEAGFAKAGGISVRLRQGFGGHSYA